MVEVSSRPGSFEGGEIAQNGNQVLEAGVVYAKGPRALVLALNNQDAGLNERPDIETDDCSGGAERARGSHLGAGRLCEVPDQVQSQFGTKCVAGGINIRRRRLAQLQPFWHGAILPQIQASGHFLLTSLN